MQRLFIFLLLATAIFSCTSNSTPSADADAAKAPAEEESKNEWIVPLKQLSEAEYPDNPDWGSEHTAYDEMKFEHLKITRNEDGVFSFEGIAGNDLSLIHI